MERKKTRGSIDEFAIIKAAAWAWFQRGSGSEGKPIREFDFTNLHTPPKPSRYKLEAMEISSCENESLLASDNSGDSSSLLDTYEIERISRELDFYIESSSGRHGGVVSGDRRLHRRVVALSESDASGMIGKGKGRKLMKGFWFSHAAVCGSRDDVVVDNIGGFGRSRWQQTVAGKEGSGG